MKKILLACTLSVLTLSAYAQTQFVPATTRSDANTTNIGNSDSAPITEPTNGFVVDNWGHAVRSSDGSCVRTGFYDAATAYHPECTPKAVPPVLPVVTPAPAVVAPTKSAEVKTVRINFAFDSYRLSTEAKQKIDTFLADNSSARKEVKIEAGTDFIGSEAYNDKLSKNRAKAVADYISSKSGFNPTEVVGLGESGAHLQDSAECKDVKHNRRQLIKCIADDRYGSVTITID